MTTASWEHEALVSRRFDTLCDRFKTEVSDDDVRLQAVLKVLGPLAGRRILDLGCGKGRFAVQLRERGAAVVGLDRSEAMLAGNVRDFDRVRGSAGRLPFAGRTFDAVVAIEVFEHLARAALDGVLAELRRVLRPGGRLVIVDKNAGALDAKRPWLPGLAVKWIDQKRGLWMYPPDSPVREHWFWPRALHRRLHRDFDRVQVEALLSPSEARWWVFRAVPRTRLLTLWSARAPASGGTSA